MPAKTYQSLQDEIHVLYEGNTSTPASGDDDFLTRQSFINQAVDNWEQWEGMLWNELYTEATGTTTASATITLPTNFNFLTGFVLIQDSSGGWLEYQRIPVENAHTYLNDTGDRVCWITGDAGSYVLNFPEDLTADLNYRIPYYKFATHVDANSLSTTVEMSDPQFIVQSVLAELYRFDNNYAGYNSAKQEADRRMQRMVVKNAMNPYYQPNAIPDALNIGFGV